VITIHTNGALGIDLSPSEISANDLGDGDSGANTLQNFPVLTSAITTGNDTTITGTLNSTASEVFRIEFFSNPTGDASGSGEGQTYLGTANVATDGSGNATINTTLVGVSVASGDQVSATATFLTGGVTPASTSEFSVNVSAVTSLIVDTTSDVADGDTSSIAALNLDRGTDGVISLREAITAANNTPNGGPAEIHFNIAGGGPHTILVTSALPNITEAVVIDGATEPDFAGTPIVELDGTSAGASDGLRLLSGNSTVRGLVINRFSGFGLSVLSNSNVIVGNYIGTNVSGTSDLGNTSSGIQLSGSSNTIGGTTAVDRNVISGNDVHGIIAATASPSNNIIQGNYIGVDAAGSAALLNGQEAIRIQDGTNNTVGGVTAAAGNVIVGGAFRGIDVRSGTSSNVIQSNLIGTNASGTVDLTAGTGIRVLDSPNNIIGGAGVGNLIAGHSGANGGIFLTGAATTGTIVQGNKIGTDLAGTSALPNFNGILIDGASISTIGGTAVGEGNLIAFNGNVGVNIRNGTGNVVLGNSIHSNTGLGIDLDDDGVDSNDDGDGDVGANNVQNYPVLSSAVSSGGNTTIAGALNSTASTTFDIHFYSSPAADGTGFGEAAVYLGTASVTTNGSGDVAFNEVLVGAVTPGHFVTATATDASGNTRPSFR
jgi:hypothetical protein